MVGSVDCTIIAERYNLVQSVGLCPFNSRDVQSYTFKNMLEITGRSFIVFGR